jgi:hypothetical protein
LANGGPEWLPLEKAFEHFADPEAKKRYQKALADRKANPGLPSWLQMRVIENEDPSLRSDLLPDAQPVRQPISEEQDELWRASARAKRDMERSFFDRLLSGELICRAREGSPIAPWRDVPADAWKMLKVEHWSTGRLKVAGTEQRLFSTEVALRPASAAVASKLAAEMTLERPIQLAGETRQERRAFSGTKIERWYIEKWIPHNSAEGKSPSRDEDLRAARAIFSGVSRAFMRDLRQRRAPAEWRTVGRPRTRPR